MEIIIKHEVTDDHLLDLLTTAIEGGVGYWACLHNDHEDWIEARNQWKATHDNETPCYCDTALQVLKNNKAVIFSDTESETEGYEDENSEVWKLTMEKLLNGIKIFEVKHGKFLSKIMENAEFDADDADCIIQYALFGKLIYC